MSIVLALDQGTTSSRAIVFDHDGSLRGSAQQEFEQHFPRPGWVEHDPGEIWSSQAGVIDRALDAAGVTGSDVAAVGITNQRETTIVWDRSTGEPVYPAIVWQDRRTAPLCDRLRKDGTEDRFREKTGLLLDPYFSGTKLAWILDSVDGVRARADRGELAFGTVDTWLAWKLTDGKLHITDASNASRTLLYNLADHDWDDELLEILNIPRSLMPEIRASSEVYGEIAGVSSLAGVPLASLVGDQQAASMGQVCTRPGLAKNTYGTGCFLLMNTGESPRVSENRLLTTVAWRFGEEITYSLEGSMFVGGAIVQWLRDGLGIIGESAEVEALAREVPDTGGVVMVPALAGLGAPHWDSYARGLIIGITRGTTRAHIARAALEGLAYSVADMVTAMEADAGTALPELRVDGGAAANDLLLQMQADILQVPVVRPTVLETTALGAAVMAGLAVGYWASLDEVASHWQEERRFEPAVAGPEADRMRERWQEAVRRSLAWEQEESS